MKNLWLSLRYLLPVLMLYACGSDDSGVATNYIVPESEADGIAVASAEDLGVDVGLLSQLKAANENNTFQNVHSVLVAKDNQLIYEEYFAGQPIYEAHTNWNKHALHRLHSVTKSFNSALIGIAVDQYGLSIDDPVRNFFPEVEEIYWEGMKSDITVEHLLTMSSGLRWDEWSFSYDDPRNDHYGLSRSDHWVHYILELPIEDVPGSKFLYNSGLSITLGEIVRRHTGKDVGLFAKEHLFDPLGIDNIQWDTSPNSIYQTGGGLRLRPRDMLKFGLLYLNNGVWDGQQVVSADWVDKSSKSQGPNRGYSFQWWLQTYFIPGGRYMAYLAAGRGGQYIIVVEELNAVVVFTAGNDNNLALSQTREMMVEYVLPSLQE